MARHKRSSTRAGKSRDRRPAGARLSVTPESPSCSTTTSAGARWFPLLILAAGAAAYSSSFNGVFLLDDLIRIRDNPYLEAPVTSMTWLGDKLRRPLVSLTLAINQTLGGALWGFHLINLIIHLAAGLALYGIIRRTLRLPRFAGRYDDTADGLALVAALLWTLHPLQTSAVTYIIQRCESMMGMFYLLTLYLMLRGATSIGPRRWHVLAVFACLGGMLSKAVMVTAPLVILLFDRTFLAGSFREIVRRRWGLYAGLLASLLFLADGGFFPNMFNAIASLPDAAPVVQKGLGGIPPLYYAVSQPGVILHYLRLTFLPVGLCFDYWWPVAATAREIVPPMAGLAALIFVTLLAAWKRPALAFPPVWFFLILAPTSSIRPLHSVAFEHRMYLPLAGIIVLAVVGALHLLQRGSPRVPRRIGAVVALGAACALGVGTFQRNRLYHSELAMWQSVIAQRPDNPRARSNLALCLARQGDFDGAIQHLEHALALWPEYGEAHNNMAMALLRKQRPAEALTHANLALAAWPENPDAFVNKAGALLDLGDTEGAIAAYREVLRLKPRYVAIRSDLGAAYAQHGDLAAAIEQYELALAHNPNDHMAINNLGGAYFDMGRLDDAIAQFRKAIVQRADYADAHHNLGLAYKKQGRLTDAIASYREAIRIHPDYADAHNNLGGALLAAGDPAGAVAHYEKALAIRSDFPIARTNLGHARYFQAIEQEKSGQIEAAIDGYRRTLEIIPDHAQAKARLDRLMTDGQMAASALQ